MPHRHKQNRIKTLGIRILHFFGIHLHRHHHHYHTEHLIVLPVGQEPVYRELPDSGQEVTTQESQHLHTHTHREHRYRHRLPGERQRTGIQTKVSFRRRIRRWFRERFRWLHPKRRHHHHASDSQFLPLRKPKVTLKMRIKKWFREHKSLDTIYSILLSQAAAISTIMASYILIWFVYQCAVIFTAAMYDIHAVLRYFEVMFLASNSSPLWTRPDILAITLSGPFVAVVIMGILMLKLYRSSHYTTLIYQLLLWLMLMAAAHFFGSFIAGAITLQGMGYVIAWLFMPFAVKLLVSLMFLSVMMFLGWMAGPYFLRLSSGHPRKEDKPFILFGRVVVPWVVATVILVLIKIPNLPPQHENIWDYDVLILASVGFAVIPALFNKKSLPANSIKYPKSKRKHRLVVWLWILVAVVLVLLYRLGLKDGLTVYLKMVLNISAYQ